jgi:hypothetical protein
MAIYKRGETMKTNKSGNANGNGKSQVSMNDVAKMLENMQAQLAELKTENIQLRANGNGKKASVSAYAYEHIAKDAEGKPASRITVKDGQAFIQSYSGLKPTWNGEPSDGWIEGKMANGRKGYYIPKKAAPVSKNDLVALLKHL